MQLLRKKAKQDKDLLWHITPKLHYMQHFPQEAKLINPRLVQCYIEESYIGKMAQIWASCKYGKYKESIQYWALLKYLVWLVIELDLLPAEPAWLNQLANLPRVQRLHQPDSTQPVAPAR